MLTRVALAAVLGAVAGMLVATGGKMWPERTETIAYYTARTTARVESAWLALRHPHAP
jgi:hypothetical protein